MRRNILNITLLISLLALIATRAAAQGEYVPEWPPEIEIFKDNVKKAPLGKNQIRVASYSIKPEVAPSDSRLENWQSRVKQVTHILRDCNIDIAGTQRAMYWQMAQVMKITGLATVGACSDSLNPAAASQAILYNPRRVEVKEWGSISLSTQKEKENTPHACTWAKFRQIDGGKVFYVFNTLIRTTFEADSLLTIIRNTAKKTPVILTGDLGDQPYKPVPMRFKKAGYGDSYDKANYRAGKFGTFHDYRSKSPTRRHDYVFLSPDFTVDYYDVVDEELTTIRPGSDHMPVVTDLTIGKAK